MDPGNVAAKIRLVCWLPNTCGPCRVPRSLAAVHTAAHTCSCRRSSRGDFRTWRSSRATSSRPSPGWRWQRYALVLLNLKYIVVYRGFRPGNWPPYSGLTWRGMSPAASA
eukprot:scaffold443_cov527-Prasinococcus_capsulatus_cf.AAC.2